MIHLPVTKAHWLYIPRSGIHPVKKYAGDICFEKQLIQGICSHLRYIFQPKSKISCPPTVPLGLAWHSSSASVGVWGAPAKIEENKHFMPPTWKWTSETDNKIRSILPGRPSDWRKMPTSLLLQVACSKKGPARGLWICRYFWPTSTKTHPTPNQRLHLGPLCGRFLQQQIVRLLLWLRLVRYQTLLKFKKITKKK